MQQLEFRLLDDQQDRLLLLLVSADLGEDLIDVNPHSNNRNTGTGVDYVNDDTNLLVFEEDNKTTIAEPTEGGGEQYYDNVHDIADEEFVDGDGCDADEDHNDFEDGV